MSTILGLNGGGNLYDQFIEFTGICFDIEHDTHANLK